MEHFKPIQNAVSTPWKKQISSEQLAQIKTDYWPEQMEDKWMVISEEQHGKTLVHFGRSWTGIDVYILTIRDTTDGAEIESLTWNAGGDDLPTSDEAEAKDMVVGLSKGLLGVELS